MSKKNTDKFAIFSEDADEWKTVPYDSIAQLNQGLKDGAIDIDPFDEGLVLYKLTDTKLPIINIRQIVM